MADVRKYFGAIPERVGLPNKGLDKRASTDLEKGAWLGSKNVDFHERKIVKRPGSADIEDVTPIRPYMLVEFRKGNGDWCVAMGLYLAGDTNLAFLNSDDTAWQSGATTKVIRGNYQVGAGFLGYLYLSDGYTRLYKWVEEDDAGTVADAPAAAYLHAFADRLIAAGTREGVGEFYPADYHPWRVRWPVSGDASDWSGVGSGSVDLRDTPGFVTGLSSVLSQGVVYKEDAIIHMVRTGSAAAPFRFEPRYEGVGLQWPRTLQRLGSVDFFVSKDDILMYDGFRLHSISTDAKTGRSIREAFIEEANAWGNKRPTGSMLVREWGEYWIFTGSLEGQSNDKIWVYNYANKTWTTRDIKATMGTPRHRADGSVSAIYGGFVTFTQEMQQHLKDDANVAIGLELESGDFQAPVPTYQHELAGVSVVYESTEPCPTLDFQTSIDRGACWGPIDQMELHSGGVPNMKRVDLRRVGETVRFKITESSKRMVSILDLIPEWIQRGPVADGS